MRQYGYRKVQLGTGFVGQRQRDWLLEIEAQRLKVLDAVGEVGDVGSTNRDSGASWSFDLTCRESKLQMLSTVPWISLGEPLSTERLKNVRAIISKMLVLVPDWSSQLFHFDRQKQSRSLYKRCPQRFAQIRFRPYTSLVLTSRCNRDPPHER